MARAMRSRGRSSARFHEERDDDRKPGSDEDPVGFAELREEAEEVDDRQGQRRRPQRQEGVEDEDKQRPAVAATASALTIW